MLSIKLKSSLLEISRICIVLIIFVAVGAYAFVPISPHFDLMTLMIVLATGVLFLCAMASRYAEVRAIAIISAFFYVVYIY